MLSAEVWPAALVAATALHAGFQLTVTLLVYPALGEVDPARWSEAHARHSRRIVPIVGVTYLGVLVTVAGSLLVGPHASTVVAAAASAVVLALTGLAAAPLHGRLDGARDARIFGRLVQVDRLRSLFALAALGAAVVGASG